jgi:hypothetical protein
VTGLTNGRTYAFDVAARNAVGLGPPSSLSDPVIPQAGGPPPGAVPGAPAAPTVVRARDGQVQMTWPAPRAGSSPITDYVVEYRLSNTTNWVRFEDGTSAATGVTVTGLANFQTYYFRIAARSAAGTGGLSPSTGAVTVRPS